jgi:hypothetical protein
VKDGFSGKRLLLKQNIRHAPFAAMDIAFSKYLMGLCIRLDAPCCASPNIGCPLEQTILKNAVHIHETAVRISFTV